MLLFVFATNYFFFNLLGKDSKAQILLVFALISLGGISVSCVLSMRVAQLVFMEFVSQRLKVTILLAAIAQFYLDLLHLFSCFFSPHSYFFLMQASLLGSYLQIQITLSSGMSISRDSILF
jgi:hypothetical protein